MMRDASEKDMMQGIETGKLKEVSQLISHKRCFFHQFTSRSFQGRLVPTDSPARQRSS
jgi:hypothetical protein